MGLKEERGQKTDSGSGSCIVYNPYVSLSIEQQRQRLPVFKVRFYLPVYECHGQCGNVLILRQGLCFKKGEIRSP